MSIEKILAQEVVPSINPSDLGGRNFGDPEQLITEVILPQITLGLGGVAVLFLVWSGWQYITSAGDPAKAERARTNITYAIIGIVVALLAYVLVRGISNLAQQVQ
jgi:hypothetical protein